MQRYRIRHHTSYTFEAAVRLGPHALRLRPREGHELRIESSTLTIQPPARLRWHRDAEDNSVAIASFEAQASQLVIESDVVIQQYNQAPLDFVVDDAAAHYPFAYGPEDQVLLGPWRQEAEALADDRLTTWLESIWRPGERLQTYSLLERISDHIHRTLAYRSREEPGVQAATATLALGSGSCRDFASLFMAASRQLGFAARFVSGYLQTPPSPTDYGATHAWAEVYLPGAGWTGFDPTTGALAGADHIAVAVARRPERVPPVAGTFVGPPGPSLRVGVWVSKL